jgi:hypothetical protein
MKPLATPESYLPGGELVQEGLADLAAGRETDCSLLVQIAAPRLRRLGFSIPGPATSLPCEHALYDRLETRLGSAAHSYYNSLIRRIVSFARALEREQRDS